MYVSTADTQHYGTAILRQSAGQVSWSISHLVSHFSGAPDVPDVHIGVHSTCSNEVGINTRPAQVTDGGGWGGAVIILIHDL